MTERIRSWLQVAENSFVDRTAGDGGTTFSHLRRTQYKVLVENSQLRQFGHLDRMTSEPFSGEVKRKHK